MFEAIQLVIWCAQKGSVSCVKQCRCQCVNLQTHDLSSCNVKSILTVRTPEASRFPITLVPSCCVALLGSKLFVMWQIILVGPPLEMGTSSPECVNSFIMSDCKHIGLHRQAQMFKWRNENKKLNQRTKYTLKMLCWMFWRIISYLVLTSCVSWLQDLFD